MIPTPKDEFLRIAMHLILKRKWNECCDMLAEAGESEQRDDVICWSIDNNLEEIVKAKQITHFCALLSKAKKMEERSDKILTYLLNNNLSDTAINFAKLLKIKKSTAGSM